MRARQVIEKTSHGVNIPGFCNLREEIKRLNDIFKEVAVVGQAEGTGGMPGT